MKKIISNCPVCNNELIVKTLSCNNCHTEITGEFKLSKFNYLSAEQLYFIELFVKNKGSIKAVEKELDISYPTVRKHLDEIIVALGYQLEEEVDEDEDSDEAEATKTTTTSRFRSLKIMVIQNEKKHVNLQIPLEFISVLGEKSFRLNKNDLFKDNNINFKEIIDMVNKGMTGELINITTSDGTKVIIVVE